jgi:hypothetical protein
LHLMTYGSSKHTLACPVAVTTSNFASFAHIL